MTQDHDGTVNRPSDREETIEDGENRDPLSGSSSTGGQWLTERPVLEAELSDDVGVLLGRLLGHDPVETLGDWIAEIRRYTDGGSITVEDLCHADADTPHWGEFDGEMHYFRCFYDAVILSALVDEPVYVRTESPAGAEIEAEAVGTDDLRVSPEGAVFSFGVDERVEPPGEDGPSNGDVYSAVCPYVRAFTDEAAYEEWAETVPAATVALPLFGATDVAAALVE